MKREAVFRSRSWGLPSIFKRFIVLWRLHGLGRMLLCTSLAALSVVSVSEAAAEVSGGTCTACHTGKTAGFSAGHAFGSERCTVCHQGDADAADKVSAHRGLVAFPGNLSNAGQVCGRCHGEQVENVVHGLMHSGHGMVQTTRRVFGEDTAAAGALTKLGDSPADTLLRKLCASCHLGHDKERHALNPLKDRGGGCLACHLNGYPDHGHSALTARVSDQRCFGCHSRSARIALSYAGLAEVDKQGAAGIAADTLLRLADGRIVAREAADIHHRAGMSCIDCHTARGLMGWAKGAEYQEQAVDIACVDCHANRAARLRLGDWPTDLGGRLGAVPFETRADQPFLVTQRLGTPLWNVEISDDSTQETFFLHPKNGGARLRIPQLSAASHALAAEHQRLTCNACHAQWAPQCYGCHLRYTRKGRQWDHMERRGTPGRWHQRRWDVSRGLPTLGVTAEGRISPFIPGMILTVEHPDWGAPRFRRFFAATAPHTVGRARSCASCHRSPVALGLGRGHLSHSTTDWLFEPVRKPAPDGLPADAWTSLGAERPGEGTRPGERSFNQAEIQRILGAPAALK
ncbi:MAG: hypothetical protein QNJ87_13480 [Gammaproteobacteria bacterium]|nr:hypothetical protein [Gammaproteobacteria bacterium]